MLVLPIFIKFMFFVFFIIFIVAAIYSFFLSKPGMKDGKVVSPRYMTMWYFFNLFLMVFRIFYKPGKNQPAMKEISFYISAHNLSPLVNILKSLDATIVSYFYVMKHVIMMSVEVSDIDLFLELSKSLGLYELGVKPASVKPGGIKGLFNKVWIFLFGKKWPV